MSINKFIKELADKPHDVRLRIFWFIMIIIFVIAIVGWILLMKFNNPIKNLDELNFKMPSFNDIVPPEAADKLKNIGNTFNSIQIQNGMRNDIVPSNNNFKSENNF